MFTMIEFAHETQARRQGEAIDAFRALFEPRNWDFTVTGGHNGPDVVIQDNAGHAYHAVLKSSAEGRADRVTALFAQGLLEARAYARPHQTQPAVLIWVGSASASLFNRIEQFHRSFANGEAFALLSGQGQYDIYFPGLREIQSAPPALPGPSILGHGSRGAAPGRLAFTDLNQWMLKLLLAADIPQSGLLNAPRERYTSASDLARAAGVSGMTALRLANALKGQGFLEAGPYLEIVQRRKLAERWKWALHNEQQPEASVKFLAPGNIDGQVEKLLRRCPAILGRFGAAAALGVKHVEGAVPMVYVADLAEAVHWRSVRPTRPGEKADLIMRQPTAPRSVQRGAVDLGGMQVADIIQTWLDVAEHPTRGAEQAAVIEHGILSQVLGAKR